MGYAPITGTGPFAEFDIAATKGPAAALSVGPRLDWKAGDVPEMLAFKDGRPYGASSSSGTDSRVHFFAHDRLPWATAMADETGTLLGPVVRAAMIDMTVGLGMAPKGFSFAHKQDSSGKIFYGGFVGHFANAVESAVRLSSVSQRANEVWRHWLYYMRQALIADPNFWTGENRWAPGEARESQWALVMLNLAYEKTRDPFWFQAAEHVADFLLSKPLSEQGLNDPLWVWSLWWVKGLKAAPWLVEGLAWYWANSWKFDRATGLTLYAIGVPLMPILKPLMGDVSQTLVAWRDSFYRNPGDPFDWCGQCPGRTGDLVSGQWPLVKATLIQAGVTDADIPKHSALNFLPMHKPDGSQMSIVKIRGKGMTRLDCTFVAQQGDAKGGAVVVNGKRVAAMDNVKYGASWGVNSATFAPTDELELYSYDAVSVSLPAGSQVIIESGKTYSCPPMRGTLRLSSVSARLSPMTGYLSAYNEQGKPYMGLWSGKDRPCDFLGRKEWQLDLRGPMQSRVSLATGSEATWEPAR